MDGFLVKEDANTELLQAVRAIKGGGKFYSPLLSAQLAELVLHKGQTDPLTKREKEVAKLLAEGKSNKEIADLLYLSAFTVRRHRVNIMHKLELKGLADLVRYAMEHGYISDDS